MLEKWKVKSACGLGDAQAKPKMQALFNAVKLLKRGTNEAAGTAVFKARTRRIDYTS